MFLLEKWALAVNQSSWCLICHSKINVNMCVQGSINLKIIAEGTVNTHTDLCDAFIPAYSGEKKTKQRNLLQ